MWIRPQDQRIVGDVLAQERTRAGFTQAQLARKLNKPQSFVSSYENGQRRVDLLEFIRICRTLDVDALKVFRLIQKAKSG